MSPTDFETLRAFKDPILALLARGQQRIPVLGKDVRKLDRDLAPLSFSQLAHWKVYGLIDTPSLRTVASATQIRGRLDVSALSSSLKEIVLRHDALRVRIVVQDNVPQQQLNPSVECDIVIVDLSAIPLASRASATNRVLEGFLLQPIDVITDPLFGIQLLKSREDVYLLVVAMEHLISDNYSLGILQRELWTAYTQTVRKQRVSLPIVETQLTDFAVRQRRMETTLIERHRAYWDEHLIRCPPMRFPVDGALAATSQGGFATVPVHIGKELTSRLRKWCRAHQTTLTIGVLTAYVALVLRWCETPHCIVQYQSDSRFSADIANTIGYFASKLYLRSEAKPHDTFLDLLKRLTDEYCNAYEHADGSYLATQEPRLHFTHNTFFNWIPRNAGVDTGELVGSDRSIQCSPYPLDFAIKKTPTLELDPGVLLYEKEDEVAGTLYFDANRFLPDTMECFARNFRLCLETIVREPISKVASLKLARA